MPRGHTQDATRFTQVLRQTNSEVSLKFFAPKGIPYRLQTSTDLFHWDTWITGLSGGTNTHIDAGAPFGTDRFYRAISVDGTNYLTGDHLPTANGDLIIHPVNHASVVMAWNGLTLYVDPVGGASPYKTFARADLILVTHSHGDHFDVATLNAVMTTNTLLIAPAAVYASLSAAVKARTMSLSNGASTNALGIPVDAIAAYNSNHPKGSGNGYVLSLGGLRVYLTGDTDDVPEMRALRNIDVAFVCMNVPFTMTVTKAASALREFRPRIVYPYHYRNQDGSLANFQTLRQQLGTDLGIELRLRPWY
ncbi:MAG TPA: MBL fold metallo-hydrolase [Candidatus Limnocylindria bacterium]|jgi:L-ascorbate metabolism protein UlaG (beta-lactamase superfamily)|nr:MBL fold metallo-hydrolase [Candidatus Limnocylindria bacterium]